MKKIYIQHSVQKYGGCHIPSLRDKFINETINAVTTTLHRQISLELDRLNFDNPDCSKFKLYEINIKINPKIKMTGK